MSNACAKCDWWDDTHARLKTAPEIAGIGHPGLCRKHKPGAYRTGNYYVGVQPIMDAEDRCGEFREQKET